ncbi:MAG: hypothetical protein CMQ29_00390 [Gammaproteobacteria bacterium]|nr:hypothetical protein [Gammaproteobacteria bacterium]
MIGVNVDYESFRQANEMMTVNATGTALVIEQKGVSDE